MSEQIDLEGVTVDPDLTETEEQVLTELEGDYKKLRSTIVEDVVATTREDLQEAMKPNRKRLAQIAKPVERKPLEPTVRISPREEMRYQLLPEAQRKIRNPFDDHYIAMWIRGMATQSQGGGALMREAHDQLGKKYGHSRADLLEGAPAADSGLGDGTGAHLLPLPFSNLIIRKRDAVSKMRSRAQRFSSPSQTLRVPVTGVATAAMAAEGAVAAQGEPTITHKLFRKNKMQANFEASREMLADSAINLVTFFAERAGSAFGALEDVQFATSNGTAPNISESLESATIGDITITAGAINYNTLLSYFFTLPQQYHAGAVWLAASNVLQFISQIVDGNSRPLFIPNTQAAGPISDSPEVTGTLFGHPVMLLPLTAGNLFFGNPNQYGILDDGAIEGATSEHALWTSDSIAFRFTQRIDGNVMDEDAFKENSAAITTT